MCTLVNHCFLAIGYNNIIVEPQIIFNPPMSDSTHSTESSAILTWQFPGGVVDYYVIGYVLAQDSEGLPQVTCATIKTIAKWNTCRHLQLLETCHLGLFTSSGWWW